MKRIPVPAGYIYWDLALQVRGALEHLHSSPASRKRRRKGNPLPGGHPVPGGYKYRNLDLQVGGVSDETVEYGYGSERFGPLSDYAANYRPVLSSERAPHRSKTVNFRQQHTDRK
jgi:hypothetical protein